MDGAPEFKAPEKWDGSSDMTTQSDIYSLGVVLYEALAGRVPFPLLPEEAGSARAIYLLGEAHKHKVPDSIFELRKAAYEKLHPGESYDVPDYPLWLEDAIMKCLEKDPEKRFRNGKELYEFVIARKNEQERLVAETLVELERLKKESAETKEPADEEAQDTEQKDEDIVVEIEDRKKSLNRWAVVALAMALIAFGSVIFCIFGHRISGIQKPSAPLAQDHPALLYLDDQNVLVRSEVEAYPELSGLWDALNTYDYAAYSSYYGLLQNSEKYFYNLMMMRSMREKMDEMHGAGYTYVSEGKDEINLSSYLFKLMSTGRKKR
jgi:serine/threonine protein kinase